MSELASLLFHKPFPAPLPGRRVNLLDITCRKAEDVGYDVKDILIRYLTQRRGEWISTFDLCRGTILSRDIVRYHADALAKSKQISKKRVNSRFILYMAKK